MRRTCSFEVGRGFFKIIGLVMVTGRTRYSLLPPLSQVTKCHGYSTESLVSWETSQSLKTGIAVCPANEKPQISPFYGNTQSSPLSQNKGVATVPFKKRVFWKHIQDLCVWKTVLFCKRSKCSSARETQHQLLAKWQTGPSGGRPFWTQAALDFKSELNEKLFPLQAVVFSSTCFP